MAKGERRNLYASKAEWDALTAKCGGNLSRWLVGLGMAEVERLEQAGTCVDPRRVKSRKTSTHTPPVDASPSPSQVEPSPVAEVCVAPADVAANDTAPTAREALAWVDDPFAVDPEHLLAVHSSKGA